jgi:hypothetical protein
MHSFTRSCLLGICFALSLPLAMAQNTLDQKQLEASLPIAGLYQTGLAQSFQTTAASITGAGAMLRQTEEAGPITISLWDALPTQGGVKLAEGEARGMGSTWVDTFWAPVQAQAGKTYFLVFTSDIPYFLLTGSDDVYKLGIAYANDYTAFPQYDYAFRTYAGPASPPPVPEPATVAMLLAGLCLLMLRRRALD